MKDLYKTLGVDENTDADTIKKAYRKLAKQYHPDATGGDKKKTERFKEINEAYAVLSDDKKRREYDRLRSAPVGADGMPQGFDAESFAQTFGGGFGNGNVHVGGMGDIGDIFASLFGGHGGAGRGFGGRSGFGGRARGSVRGADMSGNLEVSFREAALGTRRTLRSGSGASVEVNVPPGAQTGAQLRVPGQGGPAPKGGRPGDLYLDVVVHPDPHLRRSGDDVELTLPLTVGEACLGTQVDVPTVDGTVKLTVPPGTSSGARMRLRGKGIKRADGSRGDQFCRIEVAVPRIGQADGETRRLVEELERRTRPPSPRSF